MSKKYEQMEDEELFSLLSKEKETAEKAFSELYARYSPRVFAYCRRFLSNKEEAQDVFQEAFVRFFQSASDDRVMTNVPGFLLRITRNLCVNEIRRNKNNVTFEEYMVIEDHDISDKDELLNLIKRALDLLSPEYREAFVLREYEGLSYAEIAEMTNESLSNVKIRIYRAKQKIREILAPYLADISKYE
jgi:RNA polymerase sigma-70 factor (ECF subfamily)